ncbi:hypothetical protein SAMN05421813_1621 [Daejeonella rubra]|uniref:Uncharacterized protein n=1 Tax=Daejeonella rubra TaxID=990371 RepID=A0A1G9Z8E1_9SPHI|nr:hypothetical protein SAMN05421813_1621 [Daejeonella rubra]
MKIFKFQAYLIFNVIKQTFLKIFKCDSSHYKCYSKFSFRLILEFLKLNSEEYNIHCKAGSNIDHFVTLKGLRDLLLILLKKFIELQFCYTKTSYIKLLRINIGIELFEIVSSLG